MRQVFSIVLASTALVLLASPSLAKDKSALDLAPLLDGFVEGCNFSEPLYDLIASLRPTTRDGGALAVPAEYVEVAGEPSHETIETTTQMYHLPLTGQWHGQSVAGLDLVNQDDAGMFVVGVRFVDNEDAVRPTFDPLLVESQAIIDQDEMSADFGHNIVINTDEGVTRLVCNLST